MLRQCNRLTARAAARQYAIPTQRDIALLHPGGQRQLIVDRHTLLSAARQGSVRTAWNRFHDYKTHPHDKRLKKQKEDPFLILGIQRGEKYNVVKRSFLQLAMKHHPDTSTAESTEEEEAHRDLFISYRKAFEAIVEGPDGVAILRSESDKAWEEQELNNWFKQETGGHDMPFMDAKTMKEVAEMTTTIGGDAGLDRDGGMWTLARMVTQNVKNGGDAASILQLEAGVERSREINGILRRRKRS